MSGRECNRVCRAAGPEHLHGGGLVSRQARDRGLPGRAPTQEVTA